MSEGHLEGGCLCGALRYRLEGARLDAGFCHCRLCQKASGAPTVAWGTWPAPALTWTKGRPSLFRSSAEGRRFFCPTCGTPLVFRPSDRSRTLDVTLASLDDPAAVRPEYHIWTQSQQPWLTVQDGLPRHEDGGPDTWD